MEKRELSIGDHVFFITSTREARHALITAIHGDVREHEIDGEKVVRYPCVNVVFVVSDRRSKDDWGRQIDRSSSAVHIADSSAGAQCFCFPEEWTGAPPFDFDSHELPEEIAAYKACFG